MRLLYLLLVCCSLALSQVYYRPIVPQPAVYYPVRTNCFNRCNNQNRYRFNFRPVQGVVPVIPSAVRLVTPPVPTIPTRFTFTSQSTTPTTTGTTTSLPTPSPETPAPETPKPETPKPETPKPETPEPETTTPPPSSATPSTTAAEATKEEPSTEMPTTRYMRPERRKFFNPCPSGRPLLNEFDTAISCNHANQPNGGCPEDYWCHTGASFSTTACCPRSDKTTDRCEMRRDTGEGNELVARWFYDKQAKICKRFLYKGIRGNSNNFISKAACSEACERDLTTDERNNPCRLSMPARFKNGSRIICGPADTSMCPKNHYCHMGEDPETTVCCESSGLTDPCLLSLNVGQGSASLKRFYYNTIAKRCTEFVYKGLRGNENNFLTGKQCQDACMKAANPCRSSSGPRVRCSAGGSECGSTQWCHLGEDSDTTVCCSQENEKGTCEQPLNAGEGRSNLTRWYADPSDQSCTRQCKPFSYGGLKGNQNNFLTKEDCEQTCKRECKSPCGSGPMLLTPSGGPRLCSPTSPCPRSHWCHVGITPETTVCCPAEANTCQLPMVKGHGNSHLTRWHFDSAAKKCVKFIYSGEGGNQNMFLTQDDCRLVCPVFENPCGTGKPLLIGSEPKDCSRSSCPSTHFCHIGGPDTPSYCCPMNGDPCSQEMAPGTGGLALVRFYFDKETRQCREFMYGGKGGNANSFTNMESCARFCPVLLNPCSQGEPLLDLNKEPVICGGEDTCASGYWCHVGATPETTNCCPGTRRACDLPLATGDGQYSLERWFYDGGIQMCRQFSYKGMKGNANNFLTKQACRQACKEINPCGYGEPLVNMNGDRVQCTGGQKVDSCGREFYCHVGGSAMNNVCCPRRKVDACDQPLTVGTGGEGLPRWYFDRRENRCLPFTYGGLAGNENNFISQNNCQHQCPEYRNYCPHGIPLIESDRVISCGIDKGCPDGFICHMSSEYNVSVCCQDPMDFCLSPRDPGPCSSFETRYGYNPATDTCVEYKYGGCEGTLNNFRFLQRCTEICCKEYKRKH